MSVGELKRKVGFIKSYRFMQEKELTPDFSVIPTNFEEEAEANKAMIFAFLKKTFVGSKIRLNANSFSLRLDGVIHKKAMKIREIFSDSSEWRSWFRSHHDRLFSIMSSERRSSLLDNAVFQKREIDDKVFVYIPFKPNNIIQYLSHGITYILQLLEISYASDEKLSEIYDDVMKLMEEETKRREEEARLKLQREIQELKSTIKNGLFGSLSTLEESNDLVDKTFARKMLEYTTQNNLPPFYALEATPERVVPVGTNVQVFTENGVDSEEGWIAIPGFDGIEIPEGLESQGWGEITGHSTEAKVRNSSVPLPLIVQEHLYAEFREEFWKDYYPEKYYELLEASNRIREEAKVEVQPQLEELKRQEEERKALEEQEKRERLEKEERERQERIRSERLAREQAIREEADQATQAEADHIYEDVFGESESEEESGDESQPNPSLVEQLRSQLQSSSPQERAIYEIFGEGIYVDASIVPLKWYCYIDGELEDFSSRDNALEYFKSVYTDDEDYEDGDEFEVDIRNFNTGDLIQVVHFD